MPSGLLCEELYLLFFLYKTRASVFSRIRGFWLTGGAQGKKKCIFFSAVDHATGDYLGFEAFAETRSSPGFPTQLKFGASGGMREFLGYPTAEFGTSLICAQARFQAKPRYATFLIALKIAHFYCQTEKS